MTADIRVLTPRKPKRLKSTERKKPMTDTPDWADEEASELLTHMVLEPNKFLESAAPILRAAFLRSRVAGLREAAEIVSGLHSRTFDAVKRIRAAADKLEHGS